MNIQKPGLDIVKKSEGLRLTAYLCPAGVCTIGWGHTRTAKLGQRITEQEAEELLRSDLRMAEIAVMRRVKVTLTQNQFDALVSFTFNLGEGNLSVSSLLRLVNKKDFVGAANEFQHWNKARKNKNAPLVVQPGLVLRRKAEAELFVS